MPYFGVTPAAEFTSKDLNGEQLILDADADTTITADTDDQIDIRIAGADDFQFTANTFTAQSGSTIAAQALTATTVTATGIVTAGAKVDLNGTELILDADADTSITADTDDQIDFKIAGADDFRFTANSFNILSGSTLTVDSGATIANSGTATGFGVGKIGQVLQAIKTDRTSFSFSTTNTYSTITGLTQAITCAATSSKVLVSGYVSYHAVPSANGTIHFAFFRDSTQIGSGAADASRNPSAISFRGPGNSNSTLGGAWYTYGFVSSAFEFLDSPSSTSEVVYSMKMTFGATYSGAIIINGTDVATGGSQLDYQPAASSAITVMEVLA
jgi:hypothetical protein